MLHKKLINFLWIFWCCTLCENVVAREIVSKNVLVQTHFNNGTMYVEGHSVQISYIKSLTTNRTFSKLYVYIADTFYADEDLQLNGIEELQIFAHTWNVEHPVKFDLSGWNGTNHEPTIFKGAAGNSGNNGMNGGNFLGLANELINIKHLTIISNGGNGGDGQDGTASDDTYALFNGDDGEGESGWFSQVDFHKYYEKYFGDKGYDVEISDIDDSTSLYAVFVHNKKASFNIRLHPRKCCGTTGIGGAGGTGGRNGTVIFKYVGGFYNAYIKTPNFVGINGTAGNSGKDAKTCETFALDVRADTELKKIVFFYPPLHQSFTNHFTVLNHINSSKCLPEYVKSEQLVSKPTEIKIDTSVNRYKKFLLVNIKNESLTTNIFEAYKAIDENRKINDEYSFDTLILEWYEIEKHCSELKKSYDGKLLYTRLLLKINRLKLSHREDEDEEISYCLKTLLSYKFTNLLEHQDLIMNLKFDVGYALREIEIRNNQLPGLNVSDKALVNHYNQLMLGIKGNDALAMYNHVIEGFKLAYFPFAAEYLKMYEMSASFLDYIDLNAISLLVTQKLNTLKSNIDTINSNGDGSVITRKNIDKTDPESAFYIWKKSDIRDKMRDLFAGKKITLLADVKQATTHYNALRFNTIHLVFRSLNQTVTDGLNDALELFTIALNHTGQSAFRCNNKFYELTSDSVYISSTFNKNESQNPEHSNDMYDKLRDNRAFMSPYALWEIEIYAIYVGRKKFNKLKQYARSVDFQIDMELHGTGEFIREDEPICEHADLAKFYSQMKN